ncbi:unnamed protein product, partial [Amoebophrya sp. A120]|eukprot:GSA120T00003249001.1
MASFFAHFLVLQQILFFPARVEGILLGGTELYPDILPESVLELEETENQTPFYCPAKNARGNYLREDDDSINSPTGLIGKMKTYGRKIKNVSRNWYIKRICEARDGSTLQKQCLDFKKAMDSIPQDGDDDVQNAIKLVQNLAKIFEQAKTVLAEADEQREVVPYECEFLVKK